MESLPGQRRFAYPDPGWIGLSAYSYFHPPMVADIIIAAGADELTREDGHQSPIWTRIARSAS
jgi:hypothetical protein